MMINTSYGRIHVESHGDASKPTLILLNGIMMSTASWSMFIPQLTKFAHVILMDFLDQGQSDKCYRKYKVADQSHVLAEVVESLHLHAFHHCGISYGGEVALHYAIHHHDKLKSLMVFNTTAKTSLWLKDIGNSWI